MNPNPFSRNIQNVTDPSDWEPSKLPNLKELDSLQRCYICKEFLKAPVITSCNHTFCSHCIREYLIANSHCPLCKAEQFESNLKRVILLEEIILCYTKLRPFLLDLLKNADPVQTENGEKPSSELSNEESRKRPLLEQEVIEISSDETNSSFATDDVQKKKIRTNTNVNMQNAIPTRNQMVECPICNDIMSADLLQTQHIDFCLSGKVPPSRSKSSGSYILKYQSIKKKTPSRSSNGISSFFKPTNSANTSPSTSKLDTMNSENQNFYFDEVSKHHHNDVKKLPKLDFSSLNTSKLKEKLSNLNLPVQGTRIQLELRYNQYYILFNSNLDSNHPLSEKVLRQKLSQWEHAHLAFTNQGSASLFSNGNSSSFKSITDKNFSVNEWLIANRKEYKYLVKKAKASIREKKAKIEVDNSTSIKDLESISLEKPTEPSEVLITDENIILGSNQHPEGEISLEKSHQREKSSEDEIDSLNFKDDIANSPLFTTQSNDQSKS